MFFGCHNLLTPGFGSNAAKGADTPLRKPDGKDREMETYPAPSGKPGHIDQRVLDLVQWAVAADLPGDSPASVQRLHQGGRPCQIAAAMGGRRQPRQGTPHSSSGPHQR